MNTKFNKSVATLLAAGWCLLASVVPATSMIPASLAKIVEHTESGFVGTVESVTVVQNAMGWAEEVTVRVSENVIGSSVAGGTVTWQQYRMGEQHRLAGMPEFKPGEQYLIFLSGKAPGSPNQAPVALGQGAFRIHRNTETGALYARNAFQNEYLYLNTDTALVATATVDAQANAASMSATDRANSIKRTELAMWDYTGRAGASSLSVLTTAAKTMKNVDKPSVTFALPTEQTPTDAMKNGVKRSAASVLTAAVPEVVHAD